MASTFDIGFAKSARATGGLAILLQVAGQTAAAVDDVDPEGAVTRAAGVAKFTGKALKTLDVLAPHGAAADRILVLGLGEAEREALRGAGALGPRFAAG